MTLSLWLMVSLSVKNHISIDLHVPYTNSFLILHNVLHTPFISQNLISMNKLSNDNNVIVKFHFDGFFKRTFKPILC